MLHRPKPLKTLLRAWGISYRAVAERARVSYRMVQYVADGDRVSRPVVRAMYQLVAERQVTPGT